MSALSELEKVVPGKVEPKADLSARTSLRVGGPADLLVSPQTERELAQVLDVCVQHALPYQVLGAGTNVVVSDEGVRGVVIRLGARLVSEEIVTAGGEVLFKVCAGQPLTRVVALARGRECVGMEFLAGIPGTVGGAVVMNAGTKAGSTERICVEVGVCEPGRSRTIVSEQVGFAYRRTALPGHAVVTWARFRLRVGDLAEQQRSKMQVDDDLAQRRRTQPLNLPNFGSVFRNPPGDFAGRLVQACGLKGEREGDAQISEVHANFIVNRGEAKARDVLALMRRMQAAVQEKFRVLLVPEVKLLGEIDPALLPKGLGLPREPAA